MSDNDKLIVVYAGTSTEAGYLKTVLEAEGITAFLKDEMMGAIAAPYIAAGGLGAVKVVIAAEDIERAQPILDDFQGSTEEK